MLTAQAEGAWTQDYLEGEALNRVQGYRRLS